MSQTPESAVILPVSDLRRAMGHPFLLEPDAAQRADLAADLGLLALRKLRFAGKIAPEGRKGWRLEATLGATVVQPCVVTLDPVTTRIDQPITRIFLPAEDIETPEPGSEVEVPEDDGPDVLGTEIDLGAVMAEALSLWLPAYPRKSDAELGEAVFAEEGVTPLAEADLKPFAALGALKQKMEGSGEND